MRRLIYFVLFNKYVVQLPGFGGISYRKINFSSSKLDGSHSGKSAEIETIREPDFICPAKGDASLATSVDVA